jgi:starvation-inducible DNA-binding protein
MKTKVNIGITEKNLKDIIIVLQNTLADEHVIYIKTRNYHWNIKGPSFLEIHRLLEEQYELIVKTIDEIAERIKKLGGKANGTMKEFLETTRLEEGPYHDHQNEQVKQLLDDHETIIRNLREDITKCDETFDDAVTTDFLTGVMAQHEDIAWMLRSYLG